MEENKIIIACPFWNASNFLERCVSSLMSQKYTNFQVVFIDDASDDNGWDLLPHNDCRAICIKNKENLTALPNLHNIIMNYCKSSDYIIFVDGDDYLPNNKILQKVNQEHQTPNENGFVPWITYGQFSFSNSGQIGFASAYTEEEFKHIRKAPFRVSHLRTIVAGLYHYIEKLDSSFLCMKDSDNKWFKSSYDTAIFYPLLELAGNQRTRFIDEIRLIYNFSNPLSDHVRDQTLQWSVHKQVTNKKSFGRIDSFV